MRFDDIDPRPARRAGQANTGPIAQIGDLDRRTGPQAAARRALVALTLLAACGVWWFFNTAPGTAAACVLAFSIASSGWAATTEAS